MRTKEKVAAPTTVQTPSLFKTGLEQRELEMLASEKGKGKQVLGPVGPRPVPPKFPNIMGRALGAPQNMLEREESGEIPVPKLTCWVAGMPPEVYVTKRERKIEREKELAVKQEAFNKFLRETGEK